MELYTYFRSSAAYRVRIACALKGISPTPHYIHLLKNGGEQKSESYRDINPNQTVPTLVTEDGAITQSLAILEYLEERYPNPSILPVHSQDRAFVRSIALTIACDIHPINNLRVLQYLTGTLGVDDAAKTTWYQHWVMQGLTAIETQLANHPPCGDFCHGNQPTIADICLIPQLYNSRRFQIDLAMFPTLTRIEANCLALPAFSAAAPENQPDFA